ncbi:MAG: hypothetical protein ACE5HE_02285 [Phycisphaerae bacterium]
MTQVRYGMFLAFVAAAVGGAGSAMGVVTPPSEAPPPQNERKNRYISFSPANPGVVTAHRVDLTSSTFFPDAVGVVGWVSAPYDPGCPEPTDPPERCVGEYVARLECVPVYRVWTEAYIHVGDATIVPSATYEIRTVNETGGSSLALTVATIRKPDHRNWGDVVGPADPSSGEFTGPDGFANVIDIQAAVLRMQMRFSPAPLTWIDVHDEMPNYIINISDIHQIKGGVVGWEYPYVDPALYVLPGPVGCTDCNTNGRCDVCETADATAQDCNANSVLDECDISDGTSLDCLPDGIPDECQPDCNVNGVADVCDLAEGTSTDCNGNDIPDECEPDCNGNGVPDDCDIINDPALHVDTDGDRLLDECETNTGVFLGASDAGSDPNNADSDGDGLNDGDEVLGTVSGLDLPGLGANPNRKTLLIEIDWFDDSIDSPHSHRPSDTAVQMLINAFASAPVANPDPTFPTGIELIVDYGQDAGVPGGLFTGGELIPDGDTSVGWPEEYDAYRATGFSPEREGYFHYSIHAHRHTCGGCNLNSSGIAELPGDDSMVTLQTSLSDGNVSKTMMHELGHNLGLWHGGFEELRYKPNYNSVMNYRYQFTGVDDDCDALGDDVLDYSHGLLPDLDETFLDELAGVCADLCDPPCPVDWDSNQIISMGVHQNISCFEGMTAPCGQRPDPACDTECVLLSDYDDWANLLYGMLQAGRSVSQIVQCQSVVPAKAH